MPLKRFKEKRGTGTKWDTSAASLHLYQLIQWGRNKKTITQNTRSLLYATTELSLKVSVGKLITHTFKSHHQNAKQNYKTKQVINLKKLKQT